MSINISRDLPISTDVLEVPGVLGIEEIVQVLGFPDSSRVLVDLVIEAERSLCSLPLMLHGTVGDVLEEEVVAGGNNKHKGGPSNNLSFVDVVFTLNVFP